MTEAKLTAYFNSYYDGLMDVTMKAPDGSINPNKIDNSICLFIKTNDGFKGRMRVYDKFFSKEYIILNIQIKDKKDIDKFLTEANETSLALINKASNNYFSSS